MVALPFLSDFMATEIEVQKRREEDDAVRNQHTSQGRNLRFSAAVNENAQM